jgi:hypothetical protein
MYRSVFTPSYDKKMDDLEEKLAEGVAQKLDVLASNATTESGRSTYPVDTGAYVNSFSLTKNNEGAKRSVASETLSPGQLTQEEGYQKLKSDIASLATVESLKETQQINLINAAPHATSVERGSQVDSRWNSPGYFVFATLRDRGFN